MKLPNHLRGAIFDLDGTLLDSLHAWADVDVRFFAKRGIPFPPDYLSVIKAMDLNEAALYTKARFALPDAPAQLTEEWRGMIGEEYALRIGLKEGAAEFLRELSLGGVRLGVATSSSRDLFLPALRRLGVEQYFSAYALTQEARGKEFPDVYLLAARKLGLEPQECAVFEDILPGIRSAKSVGFYTVAVYDEEAAPDRVALEKEADAFLLHF